MIYQLNELGQTTNKKLISAHQRMTKLIAALENREVPEAIVEEINVTVANLNAFSGNEKGFTRELNKAFHNLVRLILEKLNWVPQNYYRDQWMALGLSLFGIPFGMVMALALDNFAFVGVFLPIGMVIGMSIGASMDKKAAEEGRALEL